MKIDNIDYVQSITKKMTLNLSNVIKVQSYTLDELTTSIQNLKNDEKEKILENIINNQLVELKNIPEETIISVFKQVDEIMIILLNFTMIIRTLFLNVMILLTIYYLNR